MSKKALRDAHRRFWAVLLTVAMVLQPLPVSAMDELAEGGKNAQQTQTTTPPAQSETLGEETGTSGQSQTQPNSNANQTPNVSEEKTPEDAQAPPAQPEQQPAPSKSVYDFKDETLKVTATLEDPAAIPDDATLQVRVIDQAATDKGEYNYGAYLAALNEAAGATEENPSYTAQNTLLYDVAFMTTDSETGEATEVQPTSGAVTVRFEFLKQQLKSLGSGNIGDVTVTHLPVADEAKAQTTAKTTEFEPAAVKIEQIADDNLRKDGDNVLEMRATSFSAYAVSNLATKRAASSSTQQPAATKTSEGSEGSLEATVSPAPSQEGDNASADTAVLGTQAENAYKLNVKFVNSNLEPLAKDDIEGIDLSNLSVKLEDRDRNNQTHNETVSIGDDGSYANENITQFGNSQYVSGDNVRSTLVYNGAEYKGGSSIETFDVLITDDAKGQQSTVTLRQHRLPQVTVNFLDENHEYCDSGFTSGSGYTLVATLHEAKGDNGEEGAVVGTFTKQIDTTQQNQVIDINNFGEGNHLTGNRYYTVAVEHDGLTLNDDSIIYWESYPSYVNIAGARVVSSPNATLSFIRVPALQIKSVLDPATENPTKHYYVLSQVTVGGEDFYALTPLVKDAPAAGQSQYNSDQTTVINSYVTRTGEKRVVYRDNQSVTFRLIESDNADLKITDLTEQTTAFSSGQLTSENYLVNIQREGYVAMATLTKTQQSRGTPIDIVINMKNDAGSLAAADPQIQQDLYMLTTLKPKGDSSGSPLAWSVTPLTEAKGQLNSSGTAATHIDKEYNLAGSDMKATGAKVNYDPDLYDFTLRLYRKTGNVDLTGDDAYNLIRNTANAVDTIEGYDFVGTTKTSSGLSAILDLHKAFPKTYKVRFNINPAGLNVSLNDHYYLYVEGVHGGSTSYFLMPLENAPQTTSADILVQYLDSNGNVVSKWQDSNGNVTPNVSIDGTWKVTPYLLKANNAINMNSAVAGTGCVRLTNGQNINDYQIDIEKMTYTEDAGNRRDYTSVINLNKMNVETPALTPTKILGNSAEFGVIAGRYVQEGHTETNFAVKSFSHDSNIDIDGNGENAIPFVVGRIDDGQKLNLTERMHVEADVYVGVSPEQVVTDHSPYKVNVIPSTEDNINTQVQGLINEGRAMSAALANKTTITPQTSGTQYLLDTTGFPDNSTIYVNADGIMGAISQDGGLRINKLPGQSIVFNISQGGTQGAPLTIGEFYVNANLDPADFEPGEKYAGEDQWVKSTTAALDGDPEHNQLVDDVIFEHITFNATNAKYVHLNNTAGLFLLANADEVTQSNGSGWVFAGGSDGQGGTVRSETEWHFYRHYRLYKARGDFTLHAIKKLVDAEGNPVAYENKNFTFQLYRKNDSGNYPENPDETAIADSNGNVYFSTIHYTQEDIPFASDADLTATKTFTYMIREVIPEGAVQTPKNTYVKDGIVYNAEAIVIEVVATNTRESAAATTGTITAEVRIKNESEFAHKDTTSGEITIYDLGKYANGSDNAKGDLKNTRGTVTTGFNAKKNADYPWENEDFTFTLTSVLGRDKNGYVIETPMPEGSSNGAKSVTANSSTPNPYFGDITYTTPGYYTYTIAENVPANATATIDGVEYTYAQARAEDSGLREDKIQGVVWKLGQVSYDARVHTITVEVNDGDPMTATVTDGTSFDITSDPTVTFVNKKDQTGSLKLRKQVTVDGAATTTTMADGEYTFNIAGVAGTATANEPTHTVKINVTGGRATAATVDDNAATLDSLGYVEVQSLKEGQYTITEVAPTNGVQPAQNPITVTVTAGKSGDATPYAATADFVNNLPTGGLKIQKVVVENEGTSISAGATTVTAGDYTFTVYTDEACTTPLKDASGNDVTVTLTLDGIATSATSNEISGLKPGDYWVKETGTPNNGTEPLSQGKTKVTVEAGKTGSEAVVATITNNLKTGNLKVVKSVESAISSDHGKKFPFHIELKGDAGAAITGTFGGITFTQGKADFTLADTESALATGLPAGIQYEVTETLTDEDNNLYTKTWTGNTSTIEQNVTKEAKVTNKRNTANLDLSKWLYSDNLPVDKDYEFEFEIRFEEPINGTYSGISFQNGVGRVKIKASGETSAGDTKTHGQGTVTISGLPVGAAFTVTEKSAPGFEYRGVTTSNSTQTSTDTSASGTVGTTTSVRFTNARVPGELNVTKTVTSSTQSDKTDKDFSFTVRLYQDAARTKPAKSITGSSNIDGQAYGVEFTEGVANFTLKHGQTKQIRNLPQGVYYAVEEARAEGFVTTKTGETGRIAAAVSTAKFFNDKDEGGLRVYKRVVSPSGADHQQTKTFPVTVTLSDTSINQTYGDMTFQNGVAHLNLYDGQVASATGLAKGVRYTVSEELTGEDQQKFTVTYEGETGTIGDDVVTAGVVNTHKTGGLKVSKLVESNQDSDKTRQFKFRVSLGDETISGTFGGIEFAEGVAEFTLAKDQNITIDGLPYGVSYTVEEETPTGYQLVKTGDTGTIAEDTKEATFTNGRTYTSASVRKVWNDNNNHDGKRPASIYVDLTRNGAPITTVKLPRENVSPDEMWTYTIDNLPTHDDAGNPYTYGWAENNVPAGYTLESNSTTGTLTTISNKHDDETTAKTVVKVWDDNNNQDGLITDETTLEVALLADGEPALDSGSQPISVTLSRSDNWTATIEGLDKYRADQSGSEIVYTWQEQTLPPGYSLTSTSTVGNTTTITNSYKPTETEASIQKEWDDANNQDGVRPAEIIVSLYKQVDGSEKTKLQDVRLNEANSWKESVKKLPAKEAGKGITYSWVEETVPAGYTLSGNVTSGTLTTISNRHVPETTEMEVQKVWRDGENRDAIRPQSLTVSLMRVANNGSYIDTGIKITLNANNGWHATITGLDKYANGKEIVYEWTEPDVPGYTLVKTTNATAHLQTLTNVHIPEATEATVTKAWNVSQENASRIPQSLRVALLADNVETGEVVTLSAGNNWTATVSGLPKNKDGKEVNYTWSEKDLPAGWTITNTEKSGTLTTITNTLQSGGLTVRKESHGITAARNAQKFSFTVELDDKTINGTYGTEQGGMTFTNGVATFEITDSQERTAVGLPVNVGYTVTESNTPGWKLTSVTKQIGTGESVAASNGVTGTISNDATDKVHFINDSEKGDLELSKVLDSQVTADKNKDFEFTITLGPDKVNGQDTPVAGSFTIEGGEESQGDQRLTSMPNMFVTAFVNGVATVKLRGGQTKTIKGLPAGVTYTITEKHEDGFADVVLEGETGTITSAAPGVVKFKATNTRSTGGFTLSKELVSDRAADADQAFSFTVALSETTISGDYGTMPDGTTPITFNNGRAAILLKKDEKATVSGLPTGVTYTITEAAATGFALIGTTVDGTASAETTVSRAVSTTPSNIVFKNEREPGELTVFKSVRSSTSDDHSKLFRFTVTIDGLAADKEYQGQLITYDADGTTVTSRTERKVRFTNGTATFELTDRQQQTIEGLPQGVTYQVSEDNYTSEGFMPAFATNPSGTIGVDPTDVEIVNSRAQGALVVYKQVDSPVAADKTKEFNFTVRLHNTDGSVDTTINDTYDGVQFTNGKATFTLKDGESKYIGNLPANRTFTVVEEQDANFDLSWLNEIATTKINEDGAITTDGSITAATGTTANNAAVLVGAKNTHKPGKLTLSKKVVSDARADKNATYTFKVELLTESNEVDTSINGEFSGVTFKNGVASVDLNVVEGADASKEINGLPLGVKYRVTEVTTNDDVMTTAKVTNAGGTTTDVDGTIVSGTVDAGSTVEFTNTRGVGGFKVQKAVVSGTASDKQKTFKFVVTLDDKTINGKKAINGGWFDGNPYVTTEQTAKIDFVDGVATFTLKDTEFVNITNLPLGMGYTVEEVNEAGFRSYIQGSAVSRKSSTITLGDEHVFVNQRAEGDLDLWKVVKSDVAADSERTYNATVRLYNADGTPATFVEGTYGEITFDDGVASNVPVGVGSVGKKSATGLPAGLTYTVVEELTDAEGQLYQVEWQGNTTTEDGKTAATSTIAAGAAARAIVTNTRKPGELEVTKHVTSNQVTDATRPFNFRVTLYSGEETNVVTSVNGASGVNGEYGVTFNQGVAEFTLTKDQTQTITNLPVGVNYKVEEYAAGSKAEALNAYTTTATSTGTVSGDNRSATGTITNTKSTAAFTNERTETEASIKKVWDDGENRDGKRPNTLYVDFMSQAEGAAEPTIISTVPLNAANEWSATLNHLPTHDEDGNEITYSWDEKSVPAGYTFVKENDLRVEGTLTTITNHHVPMRTEVNVKKVWNDNNDQDGERPQTLNVTLFANGGTAQRYANEGSQELVDVPVQTLNVGNEWSAKIDNLPMYEDGKLIRYAWVEDEASVRSAGYALTSTTSTAVRNPSNGYVSTTTTFTNTHNPKKTEVSVQKIWDDADNQDGMRPDHLDLALNMTVNGQTTRLGFVSLTPENNWSATVTGLDLKQEGQEIAYSWDEGTAPAGYELSGTVQSGKLTTITNRHTPLETSARIQKVWDDDNDRDGMRPHTLNVALMKRVDGETDATEERSVTINADNEWKFEVNHLPAYQNGKVIHYSWVEKDLPANYTLVTEQSGTTEPENFTEPTNAYVTTLTNKHEPERTQVTIHKDWNDANNQDGKRPENLTVILVGNSASVTDADGRDVEPIVLNEGNKWSATVGNLYKYMGGNLIEYAWREAITPQMGYRLTNTATETGTEGVIHTLTNSHEPEKTQVSVHKDWNDNSNQDGIRPESATLELMADGVQAKDEDGNDITVTLNEENGWNGYVQNLSKFKDGKEIVYTWAESNMPEGYSLVLGEPASETKDGVEYARIVATNTHTPKTINVAVKKDWDDLEDTYKKRPTELKVMLNRTVEGQTTPVMGDPVTLNASNNWSYTAEGLPAFENGGKQITYAWTEVEVPAEYALSNTQTETTVNGTITTETTTLTNHKLRGKLRFTKTVHSPRKELTPEQRKLITFEVSGAHIDRTGENEISLADPDVKVVATRYEKAPGTEGTDQDGIAAQAEGDGENSYVATDYMWESDWLPLTGNAEDDSYTVKETNSMYQWIDTRTYRVNDGETVTSADGVKAQVEDMKTTNVWISDTLVPPALVISKQIATGNEATDGSASDDTTEFTFNIALSIDETKDVAAVRNKGWMNDSFTAVLKDKDGTQTETTVKFTDAQATVTLKAGQSLSIEYLPVGVDYIVTEVPAEGYVLKNVEGTGTPDLEKASIADTISTERVDDHTAAFTNEKSKIPTVELQVTKQVIGGSYSGNEEFSFKLTKDAELRNAFTTFSNDTDQLPSNTQVKTKAGGTATFDAITYSEPGWYFYNITEVEPTNKTAGMSYETSDHLVIVRVGDDLVPVVTYGFSMDMSKYAGLSTLEMLEQYAKDLQDGTANKNLKDNKLIVTNTYTPPTTPPTTPRTTTTTTTPRTSTTTTTPRTSDDTNWMPVAALAVAGVGIVAFALIRRRRLQ